MNNFIRYSLYRCCRTIAQAAISIIGTSVVLSDVNWTMVVSASLLAGILSILTSVATGLPEVEYAEHVYMSQEEPDDAEENDNGKE